MLSKPSLEEIKSDLKKFKKYETIVYGSYINKTFTPRSDIDAALITREKNEKKNREIWREVLGQAPEKYDVKIFELLPLNIKVSLISNHLVIWGDRKEISEYFYHFRKLWQDVKFRFEENQFSSFKEKLALLRRAKKAGFSG